MRESGSALYSTVRKGRQECGLPGVALFLRQNFDDIQNGMLSFTPNMLFAWWVLDIPVEAS